MADGDDLTIEVAASTEQADSAIQRILKTIDELGEHINRLAPSLAKFSEKMDSIASGSKAFSTLDKLSKSTDNVAASSKKAEANEAMYQARLDRANVSMERSSQQIDKLAAAKEKLASIDESQAKNNAAFSMPPEEFQRKYGFNASASAMGNEAYTAPTPVNSPTVDYNPAKIEAAMDAATAQIEGKHPKVNLDTNMATQQIRQISAYIDNLTPQISGMSAEAQEKFNAIATSLYTVSQQLDNQRMIYHNLAAETEKVGQKQGTGSDAYLMLEKKMLSAASATDTLSAKQEKLKEELNDVASASKEAGDAEEKSASHASRGWGNLLRMSENMLVRISMFRLFSAATQGIATGIQDMALASSQANSTMSALSTDSLYLKNSLGAALMPTLQALVPTINQVSDALADVFNTIGMLTARIFNHASSVQIAKRSYVDYAKTINQSGNDSSQVASKEAAAQEKAIKKAAAAQEAATKKQAAQEEKIEEAEENAQKKQAAAEERVQQAIKKHQQKIDAMKKSIMGFDELNTLTAKVTDTWTAPKVPDYMSKLPKAKNYMANIPSAASYNTAATPAWNGKQSPKEMFKTVKVPEWINKIGKVTDKISAFIKTNLERIKRLLRAAPLVIGAILAFSGANVPLGIGLMAFGAIGMAKQIKEDWDYLNDKTKSSLDKTKRLLEIVGATEIAIGAIIAFSGGNVPLGIALMIGGITTTAASMNWGAITDKVRTVLTTITGIVGGASLAIGVMLVCLGSYALGVGFIIAGALDIASAIALDATGPTNQVSNTINLITGIASGAMLAIGTILVCLGIITPMSIGLIVAGAVGLAASVSLDWGAIGKDVGKILDDIKKAFGDAWDSIKKIWNGAPKWFGGVWDGIKSKFKPNLISDAFKTAWSKIQDAWKGGPDWFKNIGRNIANNVVGKVLGAVNGVIGGVNWVLGAVGSKTRIKPLTIPKYAYGAGAHPGGAAIVNDAPGSTYRELVQLPNGRAFIPKGRNVLIPNLPRGSKVLPAKETHTLFPHYAGGIGAFFGNAISSIKDFGTTMWKYISEPKKLFQLAVDKFVDAIHINEPWLSLGNSAVKFVTNHVADALKGIFAKFSPPSGVGGYGVDRWSGIATQALRMTGQYSSANLSRLLMQMQSESGGNPYSINKWDSNWAAGHPSKGLMQLIDSTFRSYAYPGYGSNIYDPLSNILASIRYTVSRYGSLAAGWRGHGYESGIGKIDFAGWNADGALFTKPALAGVGEAGPEAVLPLNDGVFSQIARGIQKNGGEDRDIDILNRMDSISEQLERLEKAILERPVNLYTTDEKIAESANKGNRQLGKRYHRIIVE